MKPIETRRAGITEIYSKIELVENKKMTLASLMNIFIRKLQMKYRLQAN